MEDALQEIGHWAELAKVDMRKAYRNVLFHPQDRLLLVMVRDGMLFVDTTLPFGLQSAIRIFIALAEWAE